MKDAVFGRQGLALWQRMILPCTPGITRLESGNTVERVDFKGAGGLRVRLTRTVYADGSEVLTSRRARGLLRK